MKLRKSILLVLLFLGWVFSLSACEEDSYNERNNPVYEDPTAPVEQKTPDDDNSDPIPSPDGAYQKIIKVDYLMAQTFSNNSLQGSAIYNDILFQFEAGNAEIFVYDLGKKEFLGSIKGTSNGRWHNNQAVFSRIFYEEGDEFPLLYTSQIHAQEQSVQAWRIKPTDELYELELVQSIKFPFYNEYNYLANINIVIDNGSDCFWLYSRDYDTQMGQLSKWKIPDPHLPEVYMAEDQMIESFYANKVFTYAQGGMMIGQRIYFVQGIPGRSDLLLNIINVNTHEVTSFNLKEYGLYVEPEGLSFYKGRFICTTNRRGIFGIYLNRY